MKVIKHEDLCEILPYITGVNSWNIDDFKRLLDKFGDDYFAEGGEWHLVHENENVKVFKEYGGN